VAWNTALAMAAATPRIPISPIPLMPMVFNRQTLQLQQVKRRAWRLLIGDYGCGSDSFARRACGTAQSHQNWKMPAIAPRCWLSLSGA
jgi:hypothetical protein